MFDFFNKYKNPILILTVLFFVGSLGFVGAGVFMEEYGPNAPIAKVGNQKIKYRDFARYVDLALKNAQSEQDFDAEAEKQLRQEVLQSMISEITLAQAAKEAGLGVSDMEIGYTIKTNFHDGAGFSKDNYIWVIRNTYGLNPADYEAQVKQQKLSSKYKNLLILAAKVTPQEEQLLKAETDKILAADKNKKSQEDNKNAQAALALAAIQLKAQDLLKSYSDKFNAENKIVILGKEII